MIVGAWSSIAYITFINCVFLPLDCPKKRERIETFKRNKEGVVKKDCSFFKPGASSLSEGPDVAYYSYSGTGEEIRP